MMVITNTIMAQDRNVYWAHGLNGTEDFWALEYVRAQNNRKIRSVGPTNTSHDGVGKYANRIKYDFRNYTGSRSIGIGHSTGGPAMRHIDKYYSSYFGGYITFGAPLDGSKLANRYLDGYSVPRFIDSSVEQLRKGPIVQKTKNTWQKFTSAVSSAISGGGKSVLVRVFASDIILDITDDLTEGFGKAINNLFSSGDQTVKDLAENSTYYNSMKTFSSSKPKITVYGDEDSPVHARLFISSITIDDNFAEPMVTAYNEVRNLYKIAGDGVNVTKNIFTCWNSCVASRKREREAWYDGYEYMNYGWENAYNELTGSRYRESYTYSVRERDCGIRPNARSLVAFDPYCDGNLPSMARVKVDPCDDCQWVWKTKTGYRWVNGVSDGLIKYSSQVATTSKWKGQKARLPGVNHLEMGDHKETQDLMVKIFNGTHGYNAFFRTSKR